MHGRSNFPENTRFFHPFPPMGVDKSVEFVNNFPLHNSISQVM